MVFSTRARLGSPRRRRALLAAALLACAVFYIAIWDGNELFPVDVDGRRQLAYLDAKPSPTQPYGRITIDQNYQSFLKPSAIDSSLFRAKKKGGGNDGQRDKGFADGDSACDDVLLFLPYSFGHAGHASQLNNYLLAVIIATFTNRAMVLLEAPPRLNEYKSNSQFGCPPEAWETKMIRTGGVPKRVGWKEDFPNGLSRLIKHPVWLSRQCPVPCQASHAYEDWEEHRLANNITFVPDAPNEVTCANDNGRESNVVVLGGRQVRDYFWGHYKDLMIDRSPPASLAEAASSTSAMRLNYDWALRLGAQPHEARLFAGLQDRQEVWDYASAFLGRAGIMRFQPWIARDVEEYVKEKSNLPLDAPYDAIHVRRGDKLVTDGKHFVKKYWGKRWEDASWTERFDYMFRPDKVGPYAKEYIPFAQYLKQFDTMECKKVKQNGFSMTTPRVVYVATDDPAEVRKEIAALPKDKEGNSYLDEDSCHLFRFVFAPLDESLGFHLNTGTVKGDCDERYTRSVAGIADLMILAKSDAFVGEFNSNWGRLIRVFRLGMNNDAMLTQGASPVVERTMKIAWGPRNPGPPGW